MTIDPEQERAPLSISVDRQPSQLVVHLSGEVDASNAESLVDVLAAEGDRDIVVDAENVTFMDSSGVRALLVSRNNAAGSGLHLALRNPSDRVLRVLEITGLTELMAGKPAQT